MQSVSVYFWFKRSQTWGQLLLGKPITGLDLQSADQNIFTARKQSLRRLCFHRCLSAGGGVFAPLHAGYNPPGQTPPGSACWDMVNQRAVRIPLEYILVFLYFSDNF